MKKGANFMCFLDRIYQPILCNNGGPVLNLICLTARRDEKASYESPHEAFENYLV